MLLPGLIVSSISFCVSAQGLFAKSCMQVAENLVVSRFASLSLNAEPCYRSDNPGLNHWELGSSVRLLPNAGLGFSFGYQFERLTGGESSWKQKLWQQVELQRRLPIGSGFGSLRLEQLRLRGDVQRQHLKLQGGVSHDPADEVRLQIATELLMKEGKDGDDFLSDLSESTTSVSLLTSLTSRMHLKLDYEYKCSFGDRASQVHQFELNLIWSGGGIRVHRKIL